MIFWYLHFIRKGSKHNKRLARDGQFFPASFCKRNAEIIWVLNVGMSKYSFKSTANKNETFTVMFPENAIAKDFSCGKTKCSY